MVRPVGYVSDKGQTYSRDVSSYLAELKKHRECITVEKDGYKNEDLMEIAYAVKTLTSSMKRKIEHAKDAYDFVLKCLPLSEIQVLGYSKNLNSLWAIWYDFDGFCKKIDSVNFFDLMQSKNKKSRRVIFTSQDDNRTDYDGAKLESMLDTYEATLKSLFRIETNHMKYFKRWILAEDIFNEDQVTRIIRDSNGVWDGVGVFLG